MEKALGPEFCVVVASITGQAWAVGINGQRSLLTAGQRLPANTQLLTGACSSVTLHLPPADDAIVGADRLLTITDELSQLPATAECAVPAELARRYRAALAQSFPPTSEKK